MRYVKPTTLQERAELDDVYVYMLRLANRYPYKYKYDKQALQELIKENHEAMQRMIPRDHDFEVYTITNLPPISRWQQLKYNASRLWRIAKQGIINLHLRTWHELSQGID